jgi:hypothetical protein
MAKRRAIEHFPRSCGSVSATGMGPTAVHARRRCFAKAGLRAGPSLVDQSMLTRSQPLLKTTPEASETVQMMPWVALRNTAGTSAGRNTAAP